MPLHAHIVARGEAAPILPLLLHALPYVLLVMAGIVLPTAIRRMLDARRWRERLQRHPRGTCERCGYDLRASPERCPECGVAAPSPETVELLAEVTRSWRDGAGTDGARKP